MYICTYVCCENSSIPIGWGCKIRRLHFCRGLKTPPNKCSGYDTQLHLMVKHQIWSLVECKVHLQCYYSLVHSDPEW